MRCRIHCRRCQLRAHREGSCDLFFGWNLLLGLTAIDVPAIRGTSWILVDVFMRKYRVKFDVTECMKHYSMCGGQRAVECGDDPSGGFSTRSAHQMSARDDLWKGKLAMMATLIPRQKLRLLFGAKTGKVRVRGHMTCLPHLSRIITFNDTSFQQCRGAWDCWDRRFFNNVVGSGIVGTDAKALGRVRLSISRVLVGLSMMRAATPVMRVKRKAHTTSRTSRQFV